MTTTPTTRLDQHRRRAPPDALPAKPARHPTCPTAVTCRFTCHDAQEYANLRAFRRAVLEQVRVDEPHRRRGFGRVLVAAALALAPPNDYQWSTTTVDDHVVAHAFWAAVGWPGQFKPDYCTDMDRAAGRLPDW
jgi:GNAT superfamily N-acetyltransferase